MTFATGVVLKFTELPSQIAKAPPTIMLGASGVGFKIVEEEVTLPQELVTTTLY